MNTFPLVHMNGTSGERLQAQYETAGLALQELERAFFEIEFNQRDYYLLSDALAWTKAKGEREAHAEHIASLKRYLLAHYNNLEEQNEARRRRR